MRGTVPTSASSAMLLSMCSWIGGGRAQAPRHVQRVDRDHRAGDVAESGHQAEQRVDAEAPVRARDAEGLVEQPRNRPQPFEIAPAAGFAFTVCRARSCVHAG